MLLSRRVWTRPWNCAAGKASSLECQGRYRDALLELGRAGILEPDLAARLADWASFRNVLAHFYPILDLRRVYGALTDIGDLEAFAQLSVRVNQEPPSR